MIGRNSIVKNEKNFTEQNAKNLPLCREIKKKTKIFHSVMTSMTMFSPNQNLFNFVVSQKSAQISI